MSTNLTNNFLSRIFQGTHDFANDVFKVALYTTEKDLSVATYTTDDEASGSGYTAGGATVACDLGGGNSGRTVTFDDVNWTGSFSFKSVLIYNTSKSNRTVASIPIGDATVSITNQTITLRLSAMPILAVRSDA